MALTKDEIFEAIKELPVIELAGLVKDLEEEFGVSAAAAAPAAIAPGTPVEAPSPAEEKTDYTVNLKEIGPKKINVIKAVRAAGSLGLKEAKDLVESAPVAVKEGVGKDDAESLQRELEEAGAVVEVV